ncbi:formation of crista junctions protein 1 [Plakobranchus ocellatus]|uniref:Formation of crista junctions protein 1 n=1 Tax=Plakobranchus ocellatus TaxID=259542 RepID=A0AAV4AFH6_9GAST|nr:formation of crista junctions protein 1 [Plakobranchus ocellatus]
MQKTSTEAKKPKRCGSPARFETHEEMPRILNISVAQLIDLNFTELLPVSSISKVANYTVELGYNGTHKGVVHSPVISKAQTAIERQDLLSDCRDETEDRQQVDYQQIEIEETTAEEPSVQDSKQETGNRKQVLVSDIREASVCEANGRPKMCMTVFKSKLKAKSIAIFKPRKDQCNVYCEFREGNVDESVYNPHRERKAAAQAENSKDKALNHQPHQSQTKVVCVDVQRVLLAPSLKASPLYYKTKLQLHNYTVFVVGSTDVECFLWNEVEGGLNTRKFASCLVSYPKEHADTFDTAIVCSDCCTFQN